MDVQELLDHRTPNKGPAMSPHSAASESTRNRICESLEERLALTAQAIVDYSDLPELVHFVDPISTEQFASSTIATTSVSSDMEYIRSSYSLTGAGQTVAVIDSGIAWDHYALGGGLGEDFRVVGGWDFAENDADPFDDGPAGFHGTHVAGIIGSTDSQYEGIASGADLVGLRVFDDKGAGKLEWVEQALQWVHDHRNDFENPITTVNLSLGVNWNSNSVPNWATLEDEFSQLKKDGIFISVAAGNSFQSYLVEGVSYPAASSHVVPVASHASDGSLSDFSQRNQNVLVAPGEQIQSTVPSHIFGQTGASSRFMAASGTSMAAPYVAGASVLLREAFQAAGETNIDQDFLYDHFMRTADEIYDSVTNAWYSRLNLTEAIDAALKDVHADSANAATDLGNISNLKTIDGLLVSAGDLDFVKFNADESGRVTLTLNESNDLNALVKVLGENVSVSGSKLSFDVTAGQQYTLRLSANSGKGSYDLQVNFESAAPISGEFGLIRSNFVDNLRVTNESFYRMTAARNGILSVEAIYHAGGGNVAFEIYDDSGQLMGTSSSTDSGSRADINVSKGDSFIVKFLGENDKVDIRLTNLVRFAGKRLIVGGTGQADHYTYEAGSMHRLNINGASYEFSNNQISKIRFHGGSGSDTLDLVGSTKSETLTGGNGRAVMFGDQIDFIGKGFESIAIDGNGGRDLAVLYDSVGADQFIGQETVSRLIGGGYSLAANDFDRVTVVAENGGNDTATLHGTAGDDFLHIHEYGTSLGGDGYQNYVIGFETVDAFAKNGNDNVVARGTNAAEVLSYQHGRMVFENMQGENRFAGFEDVVVHSGGGSDTAILIELGSSDSLISVGGLRDWRNLRNRYRDQWFQTCRLVGRGWATAKRCLGSRGRSL